MTNKTLCHLPLELLGNVCAFSGSFDLLNAYHTTRALERNHRSKTHGYLTYDGEDDSNDYLESGTYGAYGTYDDYNCALFAFVQAMQHALESMGSTRPASTLSLLGHQFSHMMRSMPAKYRDRIPPCVARFPLVHHLLHWMMQTNIQTNNVAELREVLGWGADVNASNMWHIQILNGRAPTYHYNHPPTSLYLAVFNHNATIVQLLIDHGARPKETNLLFFAVVQENWDIALQLLNAGANLQIETNSNDFVKMLFIEKAINGSISEKARHMFIKKAFDMNKVPRTNYFMNQCLEHAVVAQSLPLMTFFIQQARM